MSKQNEASVIQQFKHSSIEAKHVVQIIQQVNNQKWKNNMASPLIDFNEIDDDEGMLQGVEFLES